MPRERGVRVSYGHSRLPARHEYAQGGIVKLQSLDREFPNSPSAFNVLYLVSSRLPDGAVTLARWAKRKGARFVLNQNGVAYPAWRPVGWQEINAPMRELLELADHVFYQSLFCKTTADRFAGPTPAPSEVLHNAVDPSVFAPSSAAEQRPLTLLLSGSQDAWYRFDVAVRTVAELRRRSIDARLIVAGRLGWRQDRAAARAEADALLRDLDLASHVSFTGHYTQDDAPALYQSADLLIHTKYNDPCPSVVIEAMSCGLPVVFSATGGVPELVGDAGIGVASEESFERNHPADPLAMADAVERVTAAFDAYRRRARERVVSHLNIASWLDRHRVVFAQT
ncbi:MAG: glycosyltransferase family 4 protein [Cyanobacteria bacterium]|nr:glycosyltransferase family 4 protein [Cyanobacteriota bacterium]